MGLGVLDGSPVGLRKRGGVHSGGFFCGGLGTHFFDQAFIRDTGAHKDRQRRSINERRFHTVSGSSKGCKLPRDVTILCITCKHCMVGSYLSPKSIACDLSRRISLHPTK